MRRLVFIVSVVLISSPVVSSQDGPQTAPRKPSHPVQYSSRLNLSSAAEIEQRLHASFTEGAEHPVGVNNCVQLLAKCEPAMQDCAERSSTSDRDVQAAKSTIVDCLVLQELQHATPATTSHVAELKWDANILPLLPPELAVNISAELIGKAKAAAKRGESWHDFDRTATASEDGQDQVVVQGKGFLERLIIWGRGDFNGDGIEDLLVQSLDTLTEGTYRNTRLFILTRKKNGGKLSVLRELL